MALYFVTWLIFDRLSYHYAIYATPWYLATALSFYLLFTFGLRYWPAVVIVNVVRGLISARHFLTFGWLFWLGLATAIVLVPTVWLLRRMGVRLFAGFNDAMAYLAIGCVLFPFVRSLVGVAIICASGSLHWATYWQSVYSFAVGDLVGMVTLVPLLALFLTPIIAPTRAAPEEPDPNPMPVSEALGVLALLVAGIAVGYSLLRDQANAAVYLFVFLPVMWLVLRGGLRWGVLGLLAADVGIVAMQHVFLLPANASAAYQSYIAASSFTVLALGGAINQRRREQRDAVETARRDAVTGLPSRQAFKEWLAGDASESSPVTLMLVDVETVRLAEEWLDPAGVDALEKGIGALLGANASNPLLLAHVSSNVFALVLDGDDSAAATKLAQAILDAFEAPLNVGETELCLASSIGISAGAAGTPRIDLFRQASQAVRAARERGRCEIAFYRPEAQREAVLSMVAQLHRAHRDNEFMMYYQPIWSCSFDAESREAVVGKLVGAEALLRWNHPERGILETGAFLDLLSSMPLSERIGKWVIESACRDLAFLRPILPDATMSVNLFERQAYSAELVDTLVRVVSRTLVPANALVVELNARTVTDDRAKLESLVAKLHSAQVRVAVDGFGSGDASYTRLRGVPIDVVKIDRSFVPVNEEANGKTGDQLQELLAFARGAGATALAVGVETNQQLAWFARNGCTLAQGYVLGSPMPSYAFLDLAATAVRRRQVG